MQKLSKLWKDAPLGSKLIGFASALVVVVVAVLTLVSIQREQNTFRSELESQANVLLDTLALSTRDDLYNFRIAELDDYVGIITDNNAFVFLRIYDSEGVLLIDSDQGGAVFTTESDPVGLEVIQLQSEQTDYSYEQDVLIAERAVHIGRQVVGGLVVGYSTLPLDEKIAILSYQGVLVAVLMALVGVSLMILLTRQITHPLSDLTGAAMRLTSGDLTTTVSAGGEDEVGRLARAFNQMSAALQKRESDLKTLNESLEQQVQDRTAELRKQNEDLIVAQRQAEEATRLKSQFLATMSHELRTPLNAIMGYSQLLLLGVAGELNENQHQNLDRIFKSGEDLLKLINDLLDLAKIEAGRIDIIRKPFELRSWTDDVTKQVEGLAKAKNLDFEVELDSELPGAVAGDPDRLRQIVVNLLANAIKFTEKGEVKLMIDRHGKEAWTLTVRDTGIGIPSHALEYIFDEFRQVDDGSNRQFGGTGLGLSIVRNLTLMMGGMVRVQSKVGEGSTFIVQLPLNAEKSPEQAG